MGDLSRPDQTTRNTGSRYRREGGLPPRPPRPPANSSGTLKATISLGKNPTIVQHGCPFYLLREGPRRDQLTGEANLLAYYNLEQEYESEYAEDKLKKKETLSSFLPNLAGSDINIPASIDGKSGLRMLVDNPPHVRNEIQPLTASQLLGFRLHPGPMPDGIRNSVYNTKPKKVKRKKHKSGDEEDGKDLASGSEKKHKKHKRTREVDDDENKEHKKKKKEKKKEKKKKQKH